METLCFKRVIPSSPISFNGGSTSRSDSYKPNAFSASSTVSTSTSDPPLQKTPPQKTPSFSFPFVHPWGERKSNKNGGVLTNDDVFEEEDETKRSEDQRGNWVLKILQIGSFWSAKEGGEEKKDNAGSESGCSSCEVDEECEGVVEFDRETFSKFLMSVSLAEAKLYAQMSYIGNLAYVIPKIKKEHLLRYQGLQFVTSSVEKKAHSMNVGKEQTSAQIQETQVEPKQIVKELEKKRKRSGYRISAYAAYKIAASAALYLQSQTSSILPFKPSKLATREESPTNDRENSEITSSKVASFLATTSSLTAVVSGKEEMKQAVAKDLSSIHSSPCEWFTCDNDQSRTRFFVIQGSDSMASWQANLLFEPIQFEGLDVLVHRGIYEAAKGIYEQMLPEVHAHLKSHGDSATFRFTGHSLGGSLSLLVNLMLLIRGEVPLSSLLPVITFGAPFIMCGGDQLLRRLGLPRNHVQSITVHRDIVPRAFSCNYPDHLVELLKAVNVNFRNHPCLKNQKLLFDPMGELLILQPDEKLSPHHHLLPTGNGLYFLRSTMSGSKDMKLLHTAQTVFLNSPHPLEILSDRSAYGFDGTIYRDHDLKLYLKSIRGVIRQELNCIRKAKREHRHNVWWARIITDRQLASNNATRRFSGVIYSGRDSLKRFSRFIASHPHIHLFVLLLFPARLLLVRVYTAISFL
ncbi:hypothetical protein GIB67_022913 [Kingdonia uniflora]|uniref:Fungal lipase-type domain-containing protein n=1 Tax=Kingdonia uniflora TaxID=39325 RepID=A0A7J7KW97_9MAGN|nr:hypothetical protein GIB67_022913 [Kingdonia uniflora]